MTIENFSGLDVPGALKRLGGNAKLYARLLDQFQGSYEKTGESIAEHLAASDFSTAEREAHTLKGLAGNLGASSLQTAAADLERLCRAGSDMPAMLAALDAVSAHLAAAVADIRAYLAQAAPAAPPAPKPDPAALLSQMETLLALLRDDDAGAADQFRRMRPALETMDRVAVQTLGTAIDSFDFTTASAMAESLRDMLRTAR